MLFNPILQLRRCLNAVGSLTQTVAAPAVNTISSVEFSQSGEFLATGDVSGRVSIYKTANSQQAPASRVSKSRPTASPSPHSCCTRASIAEHQRWPCFRSSRAPAQPMTLLRGSEFDKIACIDRGTQQRSRSKERHPGLPQGADHPPKTSARGPYPTHCDRCQTSACPSLAPPVGLLSLL